MDNYNLWHPELPEPTDEEKAEIDQRIAAVKAAKIAAGPGHEDAPDGERLGKLAYQLPGGTRRRMKVSADY
jgi:hypothetical protein